MWLPFSEEEYEAERHPLPYDPTGGLTTRELAAIYGFDIDDYDDEAPHTNGQVITLPADDPADDIPF